MQALGPWIDPQYRRLEFVSILVHPTNNHSAEICGVARAWKSDFVRGIGENTSHLYCCALPTRTAYFWWRTVLSCGPVYVSLSLSLSLYFIIPALCTITILPLNHGVNFLHPPLKLITITRYILPWSSSFPQFIFFDPWWWCCHTETGRTHNVYSLHLSFLAIINLPPPLFY